MPLLGELRQLRRRRRLNTRIVVAVAAVVVIGVAMMMMIMMMFVIAVTDGRVGTLFLRLRHGGLLSCFLELIQ